MESQFLYILVLMAVGVALGTVFDFYNTVSSAARWLRWIRPTLDIAFWVAAATLLYGAVFYLDNGRLRLYTFALVAVGYVLYRLTIHHQVVGSAFAILKAVEAFMRAVYRLVYSLTIRPLLVVWKLCVTVFMILYKILCAMENWVFWVIGFWCRIIFLPRFLEISWVHRVRTIIYGHWEEICAQASKWLRTKTERV
jgi:spore cortex biosynthesis protein YabQ